ncbi:Per1p KNAG_0C00730 [Huiozyma naganishii CBS 8797]|uniref:Post-GPI attachment to proteins factor 3 n=1 Tax=Huiozyma naganishii (strain ATCC MYA-139 / BCRC 22969 / CBS 8797 / KCTC 17520 / NBRC 10181 / NCYC 3082 / Yp74L-3) TaxID=1071383 RepID=J7S5J4_HUIN7|nr:hypothetical protein KNAG_0C00730 [Kazachstania naganishii CBS 8797]CCK69186.1 hypothetical protein KNAG_0C00730 [Kazachstania naganishii CBS 8797]
MFVHIALSMLLAVSPTVRASPGDNLFEFEDCCDACVVQRRCDGGQLGEDTPMVNAYSAYTFKELPAVYSRWLAWDCHADCDYQCQQIITGERAEQKLELYQFHGKWPFVRAFGMQEFFSTVFSVANFVPHYWGYKRIAGKLARQGQTTPARTNALQNYLAVAVAGMCAWSASTVFHFRDLLVTEKLDYFFAGLTVLSAFHALFIRMTGMYALPKLRTWFTRSVVAIFALHLLRLYIDWSYTYNMRFNVFFGCLQYLLILQLSYQNYKLLRSRRSGRGHSPQGALLWHLCVVPVLLVVSTSMAMSLELFDFFSYRFQIDAHALWHLATVVPSYYLYEFLLRDYDYIVEPKTQRTLL